MSITRQMREFESFESMIEWLDEFQVVYDPNSLHLMWVAREMSLKGVAMLDAAGVCSGGIETDYTLAPWRQCNGKMLLRIDKWGPRQAYGRALRRMERAGKEDSR